MSDEKETKLPVHLRDFEQDINAFISKYPYFKEMFRENVSIRRYMWEVFSGIVQMHIEEYTIPQYGDYPNDNLTTFSAEDCLTNISRYAARLKTNSRGKDETLSDLLKIAHYASIAYLKMRDYEKLFASINTNEDKEVTDGEVQPGE